MHNEYFKKLMKAILNRLKGNFIILDLGSSTAEHNTFINTISKAVTLVEIDAIEPDMPEERQKFNQRIILKTAVSSKKGSFPFYRRRYFPCSSFLEIDVNIAKAYGLEEMYSTVDTIQLTCTTVNDLLGEEKIKHVDFFKTDLEGLDFEVIKSSENIIKNSLAIQLESRFQPINKGEPYFFEVCKYLNDLGFELVQLKPEVWKFNTSNSKYWRDGRTVWGDFIFFMKEDKIKAIFGENLGDAILKAVLIAKMLGLNSYSEYLFEKYQDILTPEIKEELGVLIAPARNIKTRVISLFTVISGNVLFKKIRKYIAKLDAAMYVDKKSPWMVK